MPAVTAVTAVALAACAGVLLAALDSPHGYDGARLRRFSIALLATSAAAVAAGAAFAAGQWIVA